MNKQYAYATSKDGKREFRYSVELHGSNKYLRTEYKRDGEWVYGSATEIIDELDEQVVAALFANAVTK